MTDIFGSPAAAPPAPNPFDVPAAVSEPAAVPDFIPGTQNFDKFHLISVNAGESLREVASRAGIDPGVLFNANRGIIGSTPSSITPGMVLAVPED